MVPKWNYKIDKNCRKQNQINILKRGQSNFLLFFGGLIIQFKVFWDSSLIVFFWGGVELIIQLKCSTSEASLSLSLIEQIWRFV